MALDDVLSRLDKVRKTGADRWIARCPAHEDKGPSLALRDMGDGRTLVHCFAECAVEDVLGALGFTFDVLFPEKDVPDVKGGHRPFPAADVLRCLALESQIIAVTAFSIRDGIPITPPEYERFMLAASRVQTGVGYCNA